LDKLARFLRNVPRTKLGVLIGLITGHVRLNKHFNRIGLLSDPCAVGTSFYMRVPNSGNPKI
jgi:hypothetical protein